MEARGPHPARVPGAEGATANPRKFTEYLLNANHPQGRAKARFFAMHGYEISDAERLREEFLAQLPRVEGRYSLQNPYGGDTTKPS